VEFRDYVRLLRRRWVTIVAVLVACLAGAAAVTVLQPPSYRATSVVLVAFPDGGVSPDTVAGEAGSTTGNYTANLPEVVKAFATLVPTPPAVEAAAAAAGTGTADVVVEATVAVGTSQITIAVTAPTAVQAQSVANAYADTLPDTLVDLGQLSTRDALAFRDIEVAPLPTSTYQPNPIVNTAIGLVVGLVLGLAVAVAREALDRKIRDSRGIEDRVGVAVLGVVPHELGDVALPSVTHPDSLRAEAYRKVRTSLLFSGPDGMVKSLAVTSALSGEGKTSLAANLAVVCARAGQRVAVVDADLRQPTVHEKFGLPNQHGLADLLAGEASLADVAQLDPNGVTVVTSGRCPRDPSALLESPAFRELIAELEATHDVVVVDTTPALAVSDAAQVCSVCQGAVVVSRLRRTTYDSVARACKTLERVRTPALGIVAVGHDEDPDAGYRYYYSSAAAGGAEPAAAAEPAGRRHREVVSVSSTDAPERRGGWRRQGRTT
jgi:capsular exopolysaccharide synthesis family protein